MLIKSDSSGEGSGRSWAVAVAWMAVIAAVGVGIIYVPQPIQILLAAEFRLSPATASLATVSVQAGYAVGVFFIVALGDRLSARRLVSTQLILTSVALVLTSVAPHFGLVVVGFFIAGASATVGQVLVATALRAAPPENRARTAATIVGAIVVGLFTVRTVMGSFAEFAGWRIAVGVVALLVLALVPVSWSFAPAHRPENPPGYGQILRSIPRLALSTPSVQKMTAIHTLVFSAFIALWATSAIHAVEDLGVGVTAASLLGLAGMAGGSITLFGISGFARKFAFGSLSTSLGAATLSTLLVLVVPESMVVLVLALFLMSFAMSSEQVVTQAEALRSVALTESGRANTIYMASTFVGSSIFTAVASASYVVAGYRAVGLLALALIIGALLVAVSARRSGQFA